MMKKLSLLVFVVLCAAVVSAQHKRRVLIEEFTNASCPPCAAQNPAFNATVAANFEYLTPIKYQTNWPGYDPMNVQTQSEVAPRVTYYGVTGVPNGRQNGTLEVFPMNSYTAAMIQTAYNTLTPVTINVSHALNATLDSVFIAVSVTSDAALTGNLRLRTVIGEDEIYFDAAPGSNGETEFFNVMRKMLPNPTGEATGAFAAGETKTYNYAWKLDYFYNLNSMAVSVFLQNDDTKEVFQSERSEPLSPAIPGLGAAVPSIETVACAPGFSPSFTLNNTGSANLTSALIRYRLGTTGAWSDLNWTGDLAPGASENVQLNDIVINTNGNFTVEIQVISSNLGFQTNLAGATSTIKIRGLVDPAQALPFGNTFQAATFPPAGWAVANVGTNGWKLATNAGAGSTRSTRCNFYDMPAGQVAVLSTPKVDMSNATGASKLTFDHAYTWYASGADLFFDSLRVQASVDCGATWTDIYVDGYEGLATAPATGAAFNVPTASQWRNNTFDISNFNGVSEVLFRFRAESGFGNNLLLDNVNVTTSTGVQELTLTQFNVQPNPTRDVAQLKFGLETAQNITMQVFSAEGALVQSELLGNLSTGEHTVNLNASKMASGSYRVVLMGSEGVAQTQWVVIK